MFTQLFGKFLKEQSVISEEQRKAFQDKLQTARVKMGTIAVAEGYLSNEQAEEINHKQTQQDRRFGDIAVECGYLTNEQVEEIISKQGNIAMKYYQILCDDGGLTMNEVDANLLSFQKASGFTEEEFEALKNDDIDAIISLFAIVRDNTITDFASLIARNFTRFITSNFYFDRIRKVTEYEYSMFAGQKSAGDTNIYLGFASDNELDGITTLAKLYAKGITISGSDEVYDAICEFANLNNGLFATALSDKGKYIDMLPPAIYLNQKISGTAYIMPMYIDDKKIDIVISVDENFVAGDNPHTVKINKTQLNASQDNSKASVLVVDDSALIRKILISLLDSNGFNVVGEATNGKEGVELFKELKPDLVTLDVTMPVMDGVEALKEIIATDSTAKVAMITAAGQKEKLMEALKIGAQLFITKPFDEKKVLSSLEDLIK